MDEAPTSPKAVLVQPAATALPHIYCRVASAPSSKSPLLPCQPSLEASPRSIPTEGQAIAQHRRSDAQSDSRDMEPVAAGQYHVPSISVVQASTPGHEVKGAPVAPYNMVTSGEYASANKREITDSMAPRSPFSPPPHRHLISDVITGSDSSQDLPHHSSIQQESSGGLGQALSELQDDARLRAICHMDTDSLSGQPKPEPAGNNDDKLFCPEFQQARHAFPEYYIGNKPVRDSSSWSWVSADADKFQHQSCFFEQDGALAVASSPSAGWKQEAWHESRQQQHQQQQQHHQQQHQHQHQHQQQQQQQQQQHQQQQQQVCLSSSGQDAPAQGLTDWEPLPFKTLDMITSMDDMSDDGFAAEASRWIVQNYGGHIPTESLASAGELRLPCMHMFDQGHHCCSFDSAPIHHCACCIAVGFARQRCANPSFNGQHGLYTCKVKE